MKEKEHSFNSFPDVDWENTSQLNFDFNEFELGMQKDSPVKTEYERDSDYEPENEHLSPAALKEEKLPVCASCNQY